MLSNMMLLLHEVTETLKLLLWWKNCFGIFISNFSQKIWVAFSGNYLWQYDEEFAGIS